MKEKEFNELFKIFDNDLDKEWGLETFFTVKDKSFKVFIGNYKYLKVFYIYHFLHILEYQFLKFSYTRIRAPIYLLLYLYLFIYPIYFEAKKCLKQIGLYMKIYVNYKMDKIYIFK